MSLISTQQLSKVYQVGYKKEIIRALHNVTIEVDSGEVVALLGLNGAGKTTFVKLLLGLTFPTGGTGLVFGKPLGEGSIRNRIGYLPEQHHYPPFLTATKSLSLFAQLHGETGSRIQKRITEVIQLVGLSDYTHLRIQKYSKGMKQRLGLAHAVLLDPDLIILDEPTEGLDPIARKEIRELLIHLQSEGKTIFLNSHVLSEVERICNRAIILKKGDILRKGTLNEIIGNFRGYIIEVADTPPGSSLPSSVPLQTHPEGFLLESTDPTELNHVIDALRQADLHILGIRRLQSNLEEQFINLVGDPADGGLV
jgi:ABC-2 type transport system ATP-binding protein